MKVIYTLTNKDYFKKIDNETKAYWLGFLYADGCILEYKNPKTKKLKAMSLQIALSEKDKNLLQQFMAELKTDIPIKDKISKCNGKEYKAVRVTICNTEMCRDLINLGCIPRKTLVLKFPKQEQVPTKFLPDFIRGYFDGDGSVGFYISHAWDKRYEPKLRDTKSYNFSILGTFDFLSELQKYLERVGVNTKVKHYKSKAYELRTTQVKEVINFYNRIYNSKYIFLKRKQDKFLELIKNSSPN